MQRILVIRGGAIGDPAGYSWWIVTRTEDLTQAEIHGRFDAFMKQMAPSS